MRSTRGRCPLLSGRYRIASCRNCRDQLGAHSWTTCGFTTRFNAGLPAVVAAIRGADQHT
eukprot:3918732-Alexandrium_andersonii.AAC.1